MLTQSSSMNRTYGIMCNMHWKIHKLYVKKLAAMFLRFTNTWTTPHLSLVKESLVIQCLLRWWASWFTKSYLFSNITIPCSVQFGSSLWGCSCNPSLSFSLLMSLVTKIISFLYLISLFLYNHTRTCYHCKIMLYTATEGNLAITGILKIINLKKQ